MTGAELKMIRKGMGLGQHELAERLGVSRKSVSEWERGAPIDKRTTLAIRDLARSYRLYHDYYKVETARDGRYIVVRSLMREEPRLNAMAYFYGLTRLYGIFKRRDHAYRWAGALTRCEQPRDTRELGKEREIEGKEREAA